VANNPFEGISREFKRAIEEHGRLLDEEMNRVQQEVQSAMAQVRDEMQRVGCALAVIYFVVLASPSLGQVPEFLGGKVTTLAPLVREITPSVVNISVHGRVTTFTVMPASASWRAISSP